MKDLNRRQVTLPPDVDTELIQTIVGVKEDVNEKIDTNQNLRTEEKEREREQKENARVN